MPQPGACDQLCNASTAMRKTARVSQGTQHMSRSAPHHQPLRPSSDSPPQSCSRCRAGVALLQIKCGECQELVMRKDMKDHLHCPLCAFVGDPGAQGNHALVCPQRPCECACGASYVAKDEKSHKCVAVTCTRVLPCTKWHLGARAWCDGCCARACVPAGPSAHLNPSSASSASSRSSVVSSRTMRYGGNSPSQHNIHGLGLASHSHPSATVVPPLPGVLWQSHRRV